MTPERALAALHTETDARFAASTAAIGTPIGCRPGCSACCVDELLVWSIEADAIVAHWRTRAAEGATLRVHPVGACAFLDADGRCQVFAARPYVCRSQGAVLRWLESPTAPDAIGDDRDDDGWDDDDWDDDWGDEAQHGPALETVERRATCEVHLGGVDLDALSHDATFELGAAEQTLVAIATDALRLSGGKGLPQRVALRELAVRLADGQGEAPR